MECHRLRLEQSNCSHKIIYEFYIQHSLYFIRYFAMGILLSFLWSDLYISIKKADEALLYRALFQLLILN